MPWSILWARAFFVSTNFRKMLSSTSTTTIFRHIICSPCSFWTKAISSNHTYHVCMWNVWIVCMLMWLLQYDQLRQRSAISAPFTTAYSVYGCTYHSRDDMKNRTKTQCVCDTFITIFLNTSELENFRNKEYMNICSVCVQLLNSYSLIKYEFTSSAMAKPTSIRSKIACYRPSTQKKAL